MAYPPCVTFNYPYGTARYCRANDGRRDRISEPFGLANSINLPVFSADKSFFLDNLKTTVFKLKEENENSCWCQASKPK